MQIKTACSYKDNVRFSSPKDNSKQSLLSPNAMNHRYCGNNNSDIY